MIRVRDLHKSYRTRFGDKTVLEGVDFDLAKGERLGVLGRNGAGKSTLIRLVSGAEKPSSGRIERSMSVSWPLAFGGAFQPQLTGLDNIRFISSVYDQDFERNLAFVEDFAELGLYLREPVRSFSSGMRARLAFAISMIIEFDCFLIDEIGAVGDARFHARCNHELFEVRGDRAMIIVSHDAGYIRDHCNRWAILHDGGLSQFDDFERAYATYKDLIGAETETRHQPVEYTNRARMVDSSQRAALTDEAFRILVQQGDWARDGRDWSEAERYYRAALELYPYQRSYWVQLGHAAKEQEDFAAAEIAYRTAIALGEPLADVEEHAFHAIARQGDAGRVPDPRLPRSGPTAQQPPAAPDLEVFEWLFGKGGQEDMLDTLRAHATLDDLAATLIGDRAMGPEAWDADDEPMHERALAVFGEGLDRERADRLRGSKDRKELIEVLFASDALAVWPMMRGAIRTRVAPQPNVAIG